MSSSGDAITSEDYGNVALLYAKLVAQVLSTLMSAFVGTRHILQVVALKKEIRARRQLQTPMLAAADHRRRYPGRNCDSAPPTVLNLSDGIPLSSQQSGHTSGTQSNASDDYRRNRQASFLVRERENALYAPIGGPDLTTNESDDDRPRVSVASRILRVMCITDFIFSLSGAVVTAVELWAPAAGSSFQLTFWAQAPHWCSQVASFCWVATLALYIAKHRNRASFDVAIAHAIIWMVVVFYWVLELYSSYYETKGFVNAAKIIWKVMAVCCFLIITFCWLNFARRWRKQERRKGAYVVSKLASYTLAFFVFVGPIVVTDLALGLHSSGEVMDTCSVILAMWPFVNAVIYLTKPTLCLKLFQSKPSRGQRGQYDSADGQGNGLNRLGSRRFMSAGNGSAGTANGITGGNSGDTGQKLLMSPSHHELKGLEIGDKIGEGVAVVYLGKWRGANVAVKMKAVLAALESAADIAEFQHACNVEIQAEAEVMRGLCHPNIVLFMEAGFYRGSICIISEYCARGSLRDVLKQQTPDVKNLNWPTKLRLALGISHGIQYLHNANPPMIHRDLKSPNVLVDDSWHAKIADFGTLRFSEIVSSAAQLQSSQIKPRSSAKVPVVEMTGLVGTTRWMAPEVMRGERIYTSKVDIYSLALILWELIEGKLPFENTRWNHEVEDFVLKGVRPNIRADLCPLRWKLLIVTCWQADPRERPTIQQVINSLQRIGREEVWDPTGPRFTGVSQLGTSMSSSMSQSMSSSYLESPPAGPIGRNFSRHPAALDENHASESDSDAESFAEEFSYVPTLDSLASPAILGASDASSKSSKRSRSRSRHGSMETSASSRLSCVSTTSSTVSMGVNDSGYFGSSGHGMEPSASSISVGTLHGSTSSSISGRSVGSSRTPKIKKKRPEWRRRTDTIQETQPTDLLNAPPHTFVESSPNGTPFIVNI
ncbi:TKL protein kinase [Phytophthora nicotianae CJ01A1]|uniref:TKL protein kinase n=6 Tax=Phytophthora nicotianae TaxID=4792 RepID=W2RHG5_PHYN3|nr:TKL protein kinase [Phytophthora nicotianae INRA-310]ETI56225.1 TKL protein kinase [Phytophthora nicotianae P1569]ETK96001.1 TKL protein kinase [Phytophthora nicotianae]ETO84967.1 TKL protein kinase [Phytophthora nicotianae P1976]ETP26028.1 TKL protein kinase [Phytophthora nicotianae CJ01A1]ETP54037.1 TKL protein kinase [Phytophthora nicotianae P10297]